MPNLTNRLKLALPNGNEYVNRASLNKIFEDIDKLVTILGDFDTAKQEIDDNLAKKVAKSGDTMTGLLTFPVGAGIPNRGLEWKEGADRLWTIESSQNDLLFHNYKDNKQIFKYNRAANLFTLSADTNLLKKAGDTMSGQLKFDKSGSGVIWKDDVNMDYGIVTEDTGKRLIMQDWKRKKTLMSNDDNGFIVNADNLLKKSGDTMIGFLRMDTETGEKGLIFKDALAEYLKLYTGKSRNHGLLDIVNNKVIYEYDYANKKFNMIADTNLLKKTGDKMTGSLEINTSDVGDSLSMYFQDKNGMSLGLKGHKPSKTISLVDWEGGEKSVWKYSSTDKKFTVDVETNLLKKTGDRMEGHLEFRTNKELQFKKDDGASLVGMAVDGTGNFFAWNSPGNKYLWKLDGKTGEFAVNADNLMSKGGDTMAGQATFTGNDPMSFRPAGDNPWWLVNTSQGTMKFIPSKTNGQADWDWSKTVWINAQGEVNTHGVKVKGERVLTTSDAEEKIPSRSGKDDNGVYTIYEETQKDGKLSKRSVLSSPDVDGNYLVRTVTYYKDGVAYKTEIFDLKYDEDGDFVKAVPR
ncbi:MULTISPECIES: hypothetical protein [Bacillus]|uniref:hypothetical protein n=1 Tax=Bacillus TaxID=1386 RepID=UPI00209FD3D8|nr:hypothetical protein [Bacillus sp. 1663tsa1]MCP1180543.1 hypothetical protein [Bacillus sp. 1663tsa1]